MKKIDLGQAITILANIGVIIGIVVLVFEISQNTIAIENQIDVAVFSEGPQAYLIESAEIAELYVRSESEPWESFSAVDQERLAALWSSSLDMAELQYRLRQRSGEPLNAENIAFPVRTLGRDSFKTFWARAKSTGAYPPEFVSFFDSYVSDQGN